jgi:hypothetical protein
LCRDARDFGWLVYDDKTECFSVTDQLKEDLVAYKASEQLDEEVESVPEVSR